MAHQYQILLLLIILLFASCKQEKKAIPTTIITKKECIDNVLKLDDSLGKLRNIECKQITLSKSIKNYTKALSNLDYTSCPEVFSKTFNQHIIAWNNMIEITDKYSTHRGEMHDLFDQIEISKDSTQFKVLLKDIWNTWDNIENTTN